MKNSHQLSTGFRIAVQCLVAVALGGALSVAAAEPPVGTWAGQSVLYAGTAKSRPMGMVLKLASTRGDTTGTLQLGGPRWCSVNIKGAVQAGDGAWRLNVVNANGGRCDALIGKRLSLTPSGQETFSLAIDDISGSLAPLANYPPPAWNGDWDDSNSAAPGSLQVHLAALQPGGQAGTWQYLAPKSCHLAIEYSGKLDETLYFVFVNSNGGYCDRFVGDYIKFNMKRDDTIDYDINSTDGLSVKHGSLRRVTK